MPKGGKKKKNSNMVPQSKIINCLKIYKSSDKIINFIEKTMENWRVKLTGRVGSLAEAKIQGGIFHFHHYYL